MGFIVCVEVRSDDSIHRQLISRVEDGTDVVRDDRLRHRVRDDLLRWRVPRELEHRRRFRTQAFKFTWAMIIRGE